MQYKSRFVLIVSLEMTTELMTAQCVLFFIAGYETSSSVQSYCLYELAVNPDIQEKVQKEITETIAKHGSLTYNAVQEMPYLDMIVHGNITFFNVYTNTHSRQYYTY